MILQPAYQKIQQEVNYLQQKPLSQQNLQQIIPQQPITNIQPIIHLMQYVPPPPINDSSKYHDQLQSDFLQSLIKNPIGIDYLTIFGEKRPLDISQKKLPEPLFIDGSVKNRMKKLVRSVYQKMIQNLKYCAGQLPIIQANPLSKIQQKSHEFMIMCEQAQVAQTKSTIWKIMQDETRQMNEKAEQIQEFIQGMVEHCKSQEVKQAFS